MVLLLDNYDSFTYNIVQYLEILGVEVVVCKNDAIDIQDIIKMQPQGIVLGPGPGTPDEAGLTLACICYFTGKLPMFGVCLGHQAIAQAFGARIVRAQQVMHGRTSSVYHHQAGVFKGLSNPTNVTRYHSLIIDKATLPDALEVTAWTPLATSNSQKNDTVVDEIMAIRHKEFAIEGVQFHPESILSESGLHLFKNFLIVNNLI